MRRWGSAPLALAAIGAVLAAGCSGGSSAASSAGGSSAPGSSAPKETSFDRYKQAAPVAVRYTRALAVGNMSAAHALAAPGTGAAANALGRMEAKIKAIPVAAARATTAYHTPKRDYGSDFTTVQLTLKVRLSRAAPTEWVLLGERELLMHRSDDGSWKVAGDITGADGLPPSGMFLYTHPTLLTGSHATVVYGPGTARDEAQQILARLDASSPGLTARYGGSVAAQRPLAFVVNDREQGEQLSGLQFGSDPTPLGSQVGSVLYLYLRPYQRSDDIARDSAVVYLMTLLAARFNLLHAPWSLGVGVAGYEQNAYLNTRNYLFPLDEIATAYPGYDSAGTWRVGDQDWGRSGAGRRLASEDAVAMVHVIITQHGGSAAVIRLGQAFRKYGKPFGMSFTSRQTHRAFQRALGVSFEQVLAEAHSYVAGGSWKYG